MARETIKAYALHVISHALMLLHHQLFAMTQHDE